MRKCYVILINKVLRYDPVTGKGEPLKRTELVVFVLFLFLIISPYLYCIGFRVTIEYRFSNPTSSHVYILISE